MITVLAIIGGWCLACVLSAAIWMGIHSNSRDRYGFAVESKQRHAITDDDRRDPRPGEIREVVRCKLCGPTADALESNGFCWRCAPIVRVVRETYAHDRRTA